MAKRIANPIAVRRYGIADEAGREVVLTIGKPRLDPKRPDEWACTVLLEGLPSDLRRRGRGVDALQALQDAIRYARYELDRCGLHLTWLDGDADDFGLPLPVPTFPGSGLRQKVERYIEQALRESIREAKKRQAGKRSGG